MTQSQFGFFRTPPHSPTCYAANGAPAYRLTLSVDPTADHIVSNLTLVLSRDGAADNLLDPPGNWHGLQAHMFQAADMSTGAENATGGAIRSICAAGGGIDVTIAIRQVAINRNNPQGEDQFASLVLDVCLANTRRVNGVPTCD